MSATQATARALTIPGTLRCLLLFDKATARWNGHCLDLDLATSGKTAGEAWDNLRAVVRLHVEHCFTNWENGLTFRASGEEFALFDALKERVPFRSEKITFNLVPPDKQLAPLWIEGIELDEGIGNASTTAAAAVQ